MIESFRNINYNFLTLLLGKGNTSESFANINTVPIKDINDVTVLNPFFIYQRASGQDYSQVRKENYPAIALYDFMPEPSEFDNNWGKNYKVGGFDEVANTADIIPYPARINQRFQLSLFALKSSEMYSMLDYMYKTFPLGVGEVLWFNKVTLPNDRFVGDPVNCIVKEVQTQTRTEGLIEHLFYVDLTYWISLKPTKTFDLYDSIKIEFNQVLLT
jgi:hypothetical protein